MRHKKKTVARRHRGDCRRRGQRPPLRVFQTSVVTSNPRNTPTAACRVFNALDDLSILSDQRMQYRPIDYATAAAAAATRAASASSHPVYRYLYGVGSWCLF